MVSSSWRNTWHEDFDRVLNSMSQLERSALQQRGLLSMQVRDGRRASGDGRRPYRVRDGSKRRWSEPPGQAWCVVPRAAGQNRAGGEQGPVRAPAFHFAAPVSSGEATPAAC